MAISKLGPKGKPIRTFGQNGLARVSFGRDSARAYAATVAPNGSLVVTGFVGGWTGAAKLKPNGRLDRRFGQDGQIRHLIGPGSAGTQIAPLLGGVAIGAYRSGDPHRLAEVIRLDSRGHLVRSFGHHSVVRAKIEGRFIGLFTHGKRITVVSDNEYLAHSSGGVELRSYLPSGRPDLAFGTHCLATGAVGQNRFFHPVAAVQQPDGKIIVAGAAWNGELSQVELLRFR